MSILGLYDIHITHYRLQCFRKFYKFPATVDYDSYSSGCKSIIYLHILNNGSPHIQNSTIILLLNEFILDTLTLTSITSL